MKFLIVSIPDSSCLSYFGQSDKMYNVRILNDVIVKLSAISDAEACQCFSNVSQMFCQWLVGFSEA